MLNTGTDLVYSNSGLLSTVAYKMGDEVNMICNAAARYAKHRTHTACVLSRTACALCIGGLRGGSWLAHPMAA